MGHFDTTINIKGEKKHIILQDQPRENDLGPTIKYLLNIFCVSHRNTPNSKTDYSLQRSKYIKQYIGTYPQIDGAIFLILTAIRERKGELVPALLRKGLASLRPGLN